MAVPDSMRERKLAPNIVRTPWGFRVYTRRRDPTTGRSKKTPKRFTIDTLPPCACTPASADCERCALEFLTHYRDSYRLESKKLRRDARRAAAIAAAELRGTVEEAATTYLALAVIQAMPTFKDRRRDILLWVAVFGRRLMTSITTRDIDEQLQRWINDGYAASTVNNRRTALMSLWSTLYGPGAANPVRGALVFEEPDLQPRGLPFRLVQFILEAIPAARSHSHQRPTKVRHLKSKPRIELEAVTGMRPSQIGRLVEGQHFSLEERWYVIPRSLKGRQRKRSRTPRPLIRLHMTDRQAQAFERFHDLKCYGPYSASSRRRIFREAVTLAEARIREELQQPDFHFPADLVPYDLRHSFGTEMLRVTKNLKTVADLLDQTTTRMTTRYALGAIPDVLRDAAVAFEQAHPIDRDRVVDVTPRAPKAPRPRRRTAATA